MKQLEPYLFFNGNCAEAMHFYEKTLGGKVDMPLSNTFWVESFGMLKDKFGTAWMVSGGKQANPG